MGVSTLSIPFVGLFKGFCFSKSEAMHSVGFPILRPTHVRVRCVYSTLAGPCHRGPAGESAESLRCERRLALGLNKSVDQVCLWSATLGIPRLLLILAIVIAHKVHV